MKVLLTGAGGFVGGNLARILSPQVSELHAVLRSSNKDSSRNNNQQIASTHTHHCELTNHNELRACVAAVTPDCIIHCAAKIDAHSCEQQAAETNRVNVGVTQDLVQEAAKLSKKPLFIFCSTDLVYENAEPKHTSEHFCEELTLDPYSKYSRSKLEAEKLLRDYEGPSISFRISLVCGPEANGRSGFLGWIRKQFENDQPCMLFDDEIRTPVSINDIAQAAVSCMRRYEHGETIPRCLNLGGAESLSRYEFGKRLVAYAGYDPALLQRASRHDFKSAYKRPGTIRLDTTKLKELLGRAPYGVEDSLRLAGITKKGTKES